jgi:hypothetical protein
MGKPLPGSDFPSSEPPLNFSHRSAVVGNYPVVTFASRVRIEKMTMRLAQLFNAVCKKRKRK